jgi:hypothetical protein
VAAKASPTVLRDGAPEGGGRTPAWRTVLTPRTAALPDGAPSPARGRFARGDWVEVRPADEILATLDGAGALAGLPFMPEMAAFCGRRLRVARRAEMVCVEGLGLRTLGDAVFLEEVRCDGAAHDGCQRGCMAIWREAWLRPAAGPGWGDDAAPVRAAAPLTEAQRSRLPVREGARYICQSTTLATATTGPLGKWRVGHLLRDWREGQIGAVELSALVARALVNNVRRRLKMGELDQLTGAAVKPAKGALGLRPGERVRVRSAEEIAPTLDSKGTNQGLTFEPEMTGHAGKVHEVAARIERIIHEETGRMVKLTSTVTLRDVDCRGSCAKNCPRSNPLFWREAWLERVDAAATPAADA